MIRKVRRGFRKNHAQNYVLYVEPVFEIGLVLARQAAGELDIFRLDRIDDRLVAFRRRQKIDAGLRQSDACVDFEMQRIP